MVGFAVLFTVVIGAIGASSTQHEGRMANVHRLLSRQIVNPSLIPSQCKDMCTVLNDVTACGEDLTCLCGSRITNALAGCLQCEAGLTGSASLVSAAQEIYEQFANACESGGITVLSTSFTVGSAGATQTSTPARPPTTGGSALPNTPTFPALTTPPASNPGQTAVPGSVSGNVNPTFAPPSTNHASHSNAVGTGWLNVLGVVFFLAV